MTCQVGSSELARAAATRNARRGGSCEISEVSISTFLLRNIYFSRRTRHSNKFSAVMGLKVVFFTVVLALIGASVATDSDDCSSMSCDSCGTSKGCLWVNCTASTVGCRNTTLLLDNENCTQVYCSVPATNFSTSVPPLTPTTPVVSVPTSAGTALPTTGSTVVPTHNSNISTSTAPSATTGPSPGPHNTFDAASFIGGIVLILGLQAVIFFIYKFCKSKERNYHTL
ncbi:sialomucin core protein 24 [Pseudoliparis swirei]|uniref:sialomucin core protein 24 n=1 Tax=Pseudoliparis swirei TaxID=2059687 RepID=UPI0024BEE7A3|nr:sialomucin core protein 24 [Pseudoliparis swirei]